MSGAKTGAKTRRPTIAAIRKVEAEMMAAGEAWLEVRKVERRKFKAWLKAAKRCHGMFVARRDPAHQKELARLKEMLDSIGRRKGKRTPVAR